MQLESKDLLGIKDLKDVEIEYILDNATNMKMIIESQNKKAPHLQGKSIINLFYENSTRTRLSFELAAKYLSATAANISASSSSVAKGETLIDTGKTIDVMGTDVIIMRHPMSGAPHLLARNIDASVINAGDGMNEHPTQALLDMFTIMEKKGTLSGLKVAIIGDIYHSRVARSNVYGLTKMGSEVILAGPTTLIPSGIETLGVNVYTDIEKAVKEADVVMGLRVQRERQNKAFFPTTREYSDFFCINDDLLKLAKEDVLVMHPGPVNRGVELSTFTMDGDKSVITEQVTNGVAIRMAILYLLTRRH